MDGVFLVTYRIEETNISRRKHVALSKRNKVTTVFEAFCWNNSKNKEELQLFLPITA